MSQITLFDYAEVSTLPEGALLALDTLHTRWLSLDPQYWESDLASHGKAIKAGMSEWYLLERMPAGTNTREVMETLALRGWVELAVEVNLWGKSGPGARITREGIDAWHRHKDAIFQVWREHQRKQPSKRKRS
jgi:hypothetical protein